MTPADRTCPGRLQSNCRQVCWPYSSGGGRVLCRGPLCQLNTDNHICVESTCTAHSQSKMGARRNSAIESCPGQGCLQGEGVCSLISIPNPLIFFLRDCPAWNIGILCFSKVHVMPLLFYGRPTLVPVFTNQKSSKEDFRFYRNKQKPAKTNKAKPAFSISFARSRDRGSMDPEQRARGALPSSFPGNYTQRLSISAAVALECVSEPLCFIAISFVPSLARCVSRYQKKPNNYSGGFIFPYKVIVIASLFYVISAYKRSHRNALLLGSGKDLSCK